MSAALEPILDHVRAKPSRTWSIIVTMFGDAILPRGGAVWLGSLLAFFQPLGIADGVVRTAVSRLTADGWLERNRVGRRSFYHLAERGRDTFHRAAAHIYLADAPAWTGHLETLLLDPAAAGPARDMLRDAGFGSPAACLWMAPAGSVQPAGLDHALALRTSGELPALRALAMLCWPLGDIAAAYQRFLHAFEPLRAALRESPLQEQDAMVARILLIHEYRRIALIDPILPLDLLPPDWPGTAARLLCRDIYPGLLPASERWLDVHGFCETGNLPPATEVFRRFQP